MGYVEPNCTLVQCHGFLHYFFCRLCTPTTVSVSYETRILSIGGWIHADIMTSLAFAYFGLAICYKNIASKRRELLWISRN